MRTYLDGVIMNEGLVLRDDVHREDPKKEKDGPGQNTFATRRWHLADGRAASFLMAAIARKIQCVAEPLP